MQYSCQINIFKCKNSCTMHIFRCVRAAEGIQKISWILSNRNALPNQYASILAQCRLIILSFIWISSKSQGLKVYVEAKWLSSGLQPKNILLSKNLIYIYMYIHYDFLQLNLKFWRQSWYYECRLYFNVNCYLQINQLYIRLQCICFACHHTLIDEYGKFCKIWLGKEFSEITLGFLQTAMYVINSLPWKRRIITLVI